MSKKIVRKDSNKTKTGKPNIKVMNVGQLEAIPMIDNRINTVMRKTGRGR